MGPLPNITVRRLAGHPGQPWLVVAPSLGTSVERLWGPVAERMTGWHVIGWDLPGHGRSPDADGLVAGFDMAGLAAAVLAAVDDAGGSETTFAWAGDSVGGAVGLHIALDHPARMTRLAVLCSAARFGTPQAWAERAALVRADGMAPMVTSSPARWFGTMIRESGDDRTAKLLGDLAAVQPEGYARVCDALGSHDVRDRLPEVTVPLLAVAGADDVATPAATLREIADGVPDGRLEILAGVAHLAPVEDPDATAALLRAFLRT